VTVRRGRAPSPAAIAELVVVASVATDSQLALAWLLAQGDDIVAIPGTRSPKRVEENSAAADVELTDGELARIKEILPTGGFGARYNEAMLPTWH
jgi:aryl-alcohol dehydrogenase-like predicted oxidoreductase